MIYGQEGVPSHDVKVYIRRSLARVTRHNALCSLQEDETLCQNRLVVHLTSQTHLQPVVQCVGAIDRS